jgi:hypothetical protein
MEDLPIIAAVIYLFHEKDLPVPPLRREAPDGRIVLWFSYPSISLPALSREDRLTLHRPELWPLILLTKEPVDRIIVTQILTDFMELHLHDLLPLSHAAASWQLTDNDQNWLHQEYQKMLELFRDTPAYQWMKADATKEATAHLTAEVTARMIEEVTARVAKEVRREEQARLKEQTRLAEQEQYKMSLVMRQAVTELARLARVVARTLTRPESFQHALVCLSQARDATEAQEALLAVSDEEAGAETQHPPA